MLCQKEGVSTVICVFFQAEDGIRDYKVTGVQTCALPIWDRGCVGIISERRDRKPAGLFHADAKTPAKPAKKTDEPTTTTLRVCCFPIGIMQRLQGRFHGTRRSPGGCPTT